MSRDAARTVESASEADRSMGATLLGEPSRLVAVLAFAGLTAIGARLSVPIPGAGVPFTLQPVAVLLAGLVLGSRAGAMSQAVYLAVGAAGLPVFAAGGGAAYLLGPTGGYLLAFPLAAAVAGLASGKGRGLAVSAVWLVAALAIIHAGGLSWLWITGGRELVQAVGVKPFLIGDVLKIALGLTLARGVRAGVRRRDA